MRLYESLVVGWGQGWSASHLTLASWSWRQWCSTLMLGNTVAVYQRGWRHLRWLDCDQCLRGTPVCGVQCWLQGEGPDPHAGKPLLLCSRYPVLLIHRVASLSRTDLEWIRGSDSDCMKESRPEWALQCWRSGGQVGRWSWSWPLSEHPLVKVEGWSLVLELANWG